MRGSKSDLPVELELPDGSALRLVEWGGMSIEFSTIKNESDLADLFVGLPDDRCQCPHWGYVISGQLRFRFAEREEVYRAGDVYYVPPGHTPVVGSDTEYVEFSPADQLNKTMEVVARNMEAVGVA
jgi:hypothetical protein